MTPQQQLIDVTAQNKPSHGGACNGCGFCCASEACSIAQELLGAVGGPCPALQYEAERFWCGLMRKPSDYLGTFPQFDAVIGQNISVALGVGTYCDSDD